MESYKVLVNNESENKEIQELFFELGGEWASCGNVYNKMVNVGDYIFLTDWNMLNYGIGIGRREITLQYLRDLVVLKRNYIDDASFKDTFGDIRYVDSTNSYWMFENDIWREAEEPLFILEPIKKYGEVKMKEYLEPSNSYSLIKAHRKEGNDWIEVPEGAEIFLLDKSCGEDTLYFVKHDGDVFHEYYISGTDIPNNTWIKGTIKVLHEGMGKVLWQRNPETPNTSTQEKLKSIKKNGEVKKKEYLDTNYELRSVKQTSGDNHIPSSWIEVPEGADEYRANYKFYKNNGEMFYSSLLFEWTKSSMPEYITLWKRNPETPNTSTQDKLKFIEKWLNGEKIQYILGIESDKTQWHNFTEGAMQYIKRSDIKFREAPKYVTINGIEFKNVKSLLKHVKNNFDLVDVE